MAIVVRRARFERLRDSSEAGYAPLVLGAPEDVARIQTEKPQLVLLDLVLPDVDGIELMRQVPELSDLPVIFIGLPPRRHERASRMKRSIRGSSSTTRMRGGVSRSAAGHGLGLAICKGLVEAHGGRIRAESAGPDRGTTFTFTVQWPASPQPRRWARPGRRGPRHPLRRRRACETDSASAPAPPPAPRRRPRPRPPPPRAPPRQRERPKFAGQ